jgi:hypothetical protein
MLDPQTYRQQAHHNDLLRAAEHDRLVARATAGHPTALDQVLLRAGNLLVSIGTRLREQAQLRRARRVLEPVA